MMGWCGMRGTLRACMKRFLLKWEYLHFEGNWGALVVIIERLIWESRLLITMKIVIERVDRKSVV